MRWAKLAIVAQAVLVMVAAAPAKAVDVYITQSEYLALPDQRQIDFVAGVYDGTIVLLDADLISDAGAVDLIMKGIRCAEPMTASDMRAVLNRYIASGAVRDTDAPASSLFFALSDSC